jgi:serine/threonine protein kinase HipA of HipAB toxin-antitoxin module
MDPTHEAIREQIRILAQNMKLLSDGLREAHHTLDRERRERHALIQVLTRLIEMVEIARNAHPANPFHLSFAQANEHIALEEAKVVLANLRPYLEGPDGQVTR